MICVRDRSKVGQMGRQQADVRRDEILRAAAAVVSRKGFARARVSDVAAELGISAGLVFYHFDSKERLLSEAFASASERDLAALEETISGPGPYADRLRTAVRLYQPTGEAEGWSRDIDAWAEGLYTDEIREACRRNDTRWRSGFQRLVSEGVAAGEFRCADPQDSALRIAVLLDGLAVASQVRGTVTRAKAAAWADELVARELGLDGAGETPGGAAPAGGALPQPR
jgi:AcrR family transcriptional regulator